MSIHNSGHKISEVGTVCVMEMKKQRKYFYGARVMFKDVKIGP